MTVGKLQGQGLVKCLKASGEYSKNPVIAELNGSPTDNNATLFAQGYNSVLNPLYKNGTFKKGPNQSVPDWDNQKALTIFEQMLQQTGNKIDGVAAANDGLGNAVVSALKARKLPQIPVTGQDATAAGRAEHPRRRAVHDRLQGRSSRRPTRPPTLAIALLKGGKAAGINGKVSDGKRQVPSVLLTPVAITKANCKTLVTLEDGVPEEERRLQGHVREVLQVEPRRP